MIFRRVALSLAALVSFAMAPAAQAVPTLQLQLSSGSSSSGVLVDSNHSGMVSFSGALGSFSLNGSTALGLGSQNVFGGTTLHLNSFQVSAGSNGEIVIEATETDLTSSGGSQTFRTWFGGIVGGQNTGSGSVLKLDFYIDNANIAFGRSTLLSTWSAANSAASSERFVSTQTSSLYSQTIRATLSAAQGSISSFDAEVSQVPVPGTVALLGLGLLGLGARRSGKQI